MYFLHINTGPQSFRKCVISNIKYLQDMEAFKHADTFGQKTAF